MSRLGRTSQGLHPSRPQPLTGNPRRVLPSRLGAPHGAPTNVAGGSSFAGIISLGLALLHHQGVDFQVLLELEEAARCDQEATQPLAFSPAAFSLPPDEIFEP